MRNTSVLHSYLTSSSDLCRIEGPTVHGIFKLVVTVVTPVFAMFTRDRVSSHQTRKLQIGLTRRLYRLSRNIDSTSTIAPPNFGHTSWCPCMMDEVEHQVPGPGGMRSLTVGTGHGVGHVGSWL